MMRADARHYAKFHSVRLVLIVLILCALRSWAPVNKPRPEVREPEDHVEVAAVGAHPEEPVAAVIRKAKDDPAPVGGVGADEGVDVATLVVRQVAQARSVGADGGNVGRLVG